MAAIGFYCNTVFHALVSEAAAYIPSELIAPEGFSADISSAFVSRFNTLVSMGDEEGFSIAWAVNTIKEICATKKIGIFNVPSLFDQKYPILKKIQFFNEL